MICSSRFVVYFDRTGLAQITDAHVFCSLFVVLVQSRGFVGQFVNCLELHSGPVDVSFISSIIRSNGDDLARRNCCLL